MKCYSSVIAALLLWSGSAFAQSCTVATIPGFTPPLYQGNCVTGGIPPQVPMAALSANPANINAGQSSTLTWSSTSATSCTAGGGWTGSQAISGSLAVMPTTTTTYSLTCTGAGGTSPISTATVTVTITPPPTNACNMQLGTTPIFCDTMDNVNPGIQSRTGMLDPNVWGVSRTMGAVNLGQGLYNAVPASTMVGCSGSTQVLPPNDVVVCGGQLRESSNDNPTGAFEAGGVTAFAFYPKQPFDFANRTGAVSFDVSNDSQGPHGAWPEFWITNLPVPAPFAHFTDWRAFPQFGLGLRFDGFINSSGVGATCPQGQGSPYTGLGSVIIINNYVSNDFDNPGHNLNIIGYDCVKKSSGLNQMNHFEILVSQNQIDVYGTDAGVAPSPSTLRHLAVIQNANLGFTRGLVWLEDVHYNADKSGQTPLQHDHTFAWDNLAFDGPFTYRDFSYDALDANVPVNNYSPKLANNLGKISDPGQTTSWNVLNMPANPTPGAVRVLFNFFHYTPPTSLIVTVNGHAHLTPWPYPDTGGYTWRTYAVQIPVTDLVTGTNVVQIGAVDQPVVTSNVNIVLVNVPGGVPVLPGSNNSYPATPSQTKVK